METSTFSEKHYRVKDLAKLWHVSTDPVRDLFIEEDDVVVIDTDKRTKKHHRHRRRWRFLLIPESVAIRVYNKYGQGGE